MVDGKVLIVDERKCTGCLLCVIACSVAHTGDIDLERAHIQVWRTDEDRYVPLTCHHCETPSCVRACPTKACHQDEATQRVLIDATKCIGCGTCVVACPFGHAHYDEVAGVSVKCDYCDGRVECVRVCEPKAISYVHSDDNYWVTRREVGLVKMAERLQPGGVLGVAVAPDGRPLEEELG
jgi:Fe-S-cluster-containing hydrogenase component 2